MTVKLTTPCLRLLLFVSFACVDHILSEEPPLECIMTADGRDYHGHVNVTADGLECQEWSKQNPHSHVCAAGTTANYCTNNRMNAAHCPDKWPWCYTVDSKVRVGRCAIPRCQDVDECASSPCQNKATCNDSLNSYECLCADGFTGSFCETDMDECASNPCENEATCTDDVNGYTCLCKAGYTGTSCHTGGCGQYVCIKGA
ncbi:hypothetical protein NP493_236g03061 [Ridgeia piscesae]|uniref:Uncharacterized protein n=1 Tax=Ridgeia piscesae TaxID=27915 RepID=A0AAD9NZN7_RIDPI|nr:hypothetical protein NP493_236g03061 [Ridgeia piscesae]